MTANLSAEFPGIEIHQHGWSHTNHESTERKAEFGGARPLEERAREIGNGKALLEQMFGPAFVSVFCPPWNHLSTDVIATSVPSEGPPRWDVDFWVDDADAIAARAAELGGAAIVPPFDLPIGRRAVLADPQGATFSISRVVPA